ncbi:DUF397 domain-containing protein [Streptomyces sp. NPDC059590]|uniref:DUF397 domain-containing protein n=1 Tax=Streptomyces sp. NPDC059590 TaxID=3346877 RepID=UPI00367B0C54
MASDVAPERAWFKSSYSQNEGTVCVEIAHLPRATQVAIRDSKEGVTGPALLVSAAAWAAFITDVPGRQGSAGS